jgi:hypothetical protein
VPAVRRLAKRVRDTVGETESQIRKSNEVLEKATTPSLRALQRQGCPRGGRKDPVEVRRKVCLLLGL